MVADVHTDSNSQSVLEEGVGYVKLMVAAYQYPDGTVYLGAGPVFSTYEFKWPMAGRLTDPAWTNLLASASAPAPPAWTGSFMDPVTLFPSATSSGAGGLPLRPPVLGSGGVRLQWPAQAAARYRALYSDDLRTWFLLETPVVANGSQATIVDPGISTSGARFYRVKPVY
jgi:hypothetical protein